MRNLSTLPANHERLVASHGFIATLISLAGKASTDGSRTHIAVAMHNLCESGGSATQAIVRRGGMETFIKLSEIGTSEIRAYCAVALQSLSESGAAATAEDGKPLANRLVTAMLYLSA